MEDIKNYINRAVRWLSEISGTLKELSKKEPKEVKVVFENTIKGEKGDTPQAGKDYYTQQEQDAMAMLIENRVRSKVKDGKDADETKISERVYGKLSAKVASVMSGFRKEFDSYKKSVEDRLPKWNPTKKEIAVMISKAIPKKKDLVSIVRSKAFNLEEALLDLGIIKLIARGLEKLKGKDRLSARAIKGLPNPGGGGGGGETTVISSGTSVAVANISPQFDGVTTSFLIPAYSSILQFTITGWPPNGILLPTTDFTTPDNTHVALVTNSVSAPAAGTSGLILYVPA